MFLLFSHLTQVPLELNAAKALGIEVLCTFQMVFTVFSVEDQRRRESPEPGNLAIGLAHTAGVLIGVRWASFMPIVYYLYYFPPPHCYSHCGLHFSIYIIWSFCCFLSHWHRKKISQLNMWVELVLQEVWSILKKSNKKQPNQRKTELKYNRHEEVCF